MEKKRIKPELNLPPCPLCSNTKNITYHKDKFRGYQQCLNCSLVFVPAEYHLSQEEEKAEYDLHENNAEDAGYRKFLSRLTTALIPRLKPHFRGLDFGCGPGPTLSLMMEERGINTAIYDPFYFNIPEVLLQKYDFITATEVVEHMSTPGREFNRLFGMLNPGGILAIMTKMIIDKDAFSRWHYTHDLTHISFYSQDSFKYVASKYNAEIEFIGNDVIIMTKN